MERADKVKPESLRPKEKPAAIRSMRALLAASLHKRVPYEVALAERDFIVLPDVFSPAYFFDSRFFASTVPGFVAPEERFLELGSGIGAVSVLAALRGAIVTAIDINPEAVRNTKLNAERHGVTSKVRALYGDIFSPLDADDQFELIFWNIPFAHTRHRILTIMEQAIFDPGYKTMNRFLSSSLPFLAAGGQILIGFSSTLGDIVALQTHARRAHLEIEGPIAAARDPDPGPLGQIQYELYRAWPSLEGQ